MDFLLKRFIFSSAVIVLSLNVSSVSAEIYRWVDEDGKVQYSNRDEHADDRAESISVKDKYAIPHIDELKPIPYENEETNRLIALASVNLDMPRSEYQDVRIGRSTCGRVTDIYWKEGVVELENPELGEVMQQEFQEFGYSAENAFGSSPNGGSLELMVTLVNLKLNICVKSVSNKIATSKNASYVKVKWELRDPALDKILYTGESSGSDHNLEKAVKDGTRTSFQNAMRMAQRNLMADAKFADQIKPQNLAELKESFDKPVNVSFHYGDRGESFQSLVAKLKNNSVVVKAENGHGSGVLINGDGYILTNAHVVGDEEKFTVSLADKNFKADLIRKEKVRDVALLKIQNYSGFQKGVAVSSKAPQIGEELFVIGTPLKLELEHTITKGIMSAKRDIGGIPYFQTDAAINFGNSGGPVFNQYGELIALTVAGMFTREGASLNINYLIPIDDAVETLNIENHNKIAALKQNLEGKTLKEMVVVLYGETLQWLDEPLIKLY